ncbi:hypothetical protein D3C76_1806410 [compost metagenome]
MFVPSQVLRRLVRRVRHRQVDIVLAHLARALDASLHQTPARQGVGIFLPGVAVIRHGWPQKVNVTGICVIGLLIG